MIWFILAICLIDVGVQSLRYMHRMVDEMTGDLCRSAADLRQMHERWERNMERIKRGDDWI